MSKTASGAGPRGAKAPQSQRERLAQSEKKAAETEPGSYKEDATDRKVVEIGPDLNDEPIKGIDPT